MVKRVEIYFNAAIILPMIIKTIVRKLLKAYTHKELADRYKVTTRSIYNYSSGFSEPTYSVGVKMVKLLENGSKQRKEEC